MREAILAVLSFFASSLTTEIAVGVAEWVAWRAFILFVVMTIFPVMLGNFLSWLMGVLFSVLSSFVSGGSMSAQVLSLTGMAGCLGSYLRLPEACGLIMAAIMFRIGLQMIPGVGLGR